jgi:hypothetical protein
MQPTSELFQRIAVAHGNDFDAAIGEIPGMPAQAESIRFGAGAGAETHALHLATDEESRRHIHRFSPPSVRLPL